MRTLKHPDLGYHSQVRKEVPQITSHAKSESTDRPAVQESVQVTPQIHTNIVNQVYLNKYLLK